MKLANFRRQFVIAGDGAAVLPDEGWRTRPLQDGWALHYQSDLTISERPASDGRSILVLGDVYCLDEIQNGGSGRYVVIDWPYLHTDRAGATLSPFYGTQDGAFVVSSNANLAAYALHGARRDMDYSHELLVGRPMNYIPAPGSRFRGVRRLFRDQRINIPAGVVERDPKPVEPLGSYQQAVETAADELGRSIREIRHKTAGRILLQLTAGMDSRTLAAVMSASGVAFETMTLDLPNQPKTDVTVAARISRALGVRHNISGLRLRSPEERQQYWNQTSGSSVGMGLTHVISGSGGGVAGPDDTVIGGACFEVGRQFFYRAFEGFTLENATGQALWKSLAREPGVPEFHAFLDDWLEWRREAPYALDFVTTAYLDQRIGAWASSALAGGDLFDGRAVHPANNPRVYSALVTPDAEDQVTGRLQRDVIPTLAPDLLKFPFNPVGLGQRARRAVWQTKRAARRALRQFQPSGA